MSDTDITFDDIDAAIDVLNVAASDDRLPDEEQEYCRDAGMVLGRMMFFKEYYDGAYVNNYDITISETDSVNVWHFTALDDDKTFVERLEQQGELLRVGVSDVPDHVRDRLRTVYGRELVEG